MTLLCPTYRHIVLAFPRSGDSATDETIDGVGRFLTISDERFATVGLDLGRPEADMRTVLRSAVKAPSSTFIGGFSLGARIAAQLASDVGARGLIALGYPFHRRGVPRETPGLATLMRVRVPALLVQGTRDAHGGRETVRGYGPLPPTVRIHWLEDGNHRFRPRADSGETLDGHLRAAAEAMVAFMGSVAGNGEPEVLAPR